MYRLKYPNINLLHISPEYRVKKIQARSKILALNSSNGPNYKLQIKTFHITGVSTSHGYLCNTTKISIATLTIHFIASHFNTAKRNTPNNEQG